MRISFGKAVMKSKAHLIVLAAMVLVSCSSRPAEQPPVIKVDKPLGAAGRIEMQLDSGDYKIRAGSDESIRVTFAGNIGNAVAELTTSGTHANLAIKDTPHSNFRATIEVPATADLRVRLTAGNLDIAAITGNKDIDSQAGNVMISIPDSNDYATVDAAVKSWGSQRRTVWSVWLRTFPTPQMVGAREVHTARQSRRRQPGTEALEL